MRNINRVIKNITSGATSKAIKIKDLFELTKDGNFTVTNEEDKKLVFQVGGNKKYIQFDIEVFYRKGNYVAKIEYHKGAYILGPDAKTAFKKLKSYITKSEKLIGNLAALSI